jgi:hypothetical protein
LEPGTTRESYIVKRKTGRLARSQRGAVPARRSSRSPQFHFWGPWLGPQALR